MQHVIIGLGWLLCNKKDVCSLCRHQISKKASIKRSKNRETQNPLFLSCLCFIFTCYFYMPLPYYHRSDGRVPQNSHVFRLAQERWSIATFSRRVAILQRPIQHNQKAEALTSVINIKHVETKHMNCMSKSNIFSMSIRQHVMTQIWYMGAAIRSRPHKQYILKINPQDAMRCSKHRFKRSQLFTSRW